MKFLTDENINFRIIKGLRKARYDVKDINEANMRASKDIDILNLAIKEKRILITYDNDFVKHPYFTKIKHTGIIFLNFNKKFPDKIVNILLATSNSKTSEKMIDNLTIISEAEIIVYKK